MYTNAVINKMSRIEKRTFINNEDTHVHLPGLMPFHGKINAIKENGENKQISLIFTLRKFSIWPELRKELKVKD